MSELVENNSLFQMTQLATAMVRGLSAAQISEEFKISKNRIARWRKDPRFQELYDSIEARMTAELNQQVDQSVSEVVARRLDELAMDAVAALEEGLGSDKTNDRLQAARAILSFRGTGKTNAAERVVIPIEAQIKELGARATPAVGD